MLSRCPRLLKNPERKQRLPKFQVGNGSVIEMEAPRNNRRIHQVAQIGDGLTTPLESPSNNYSSDRSLPQTKLEEGEQDVDYWELKKVFQKLDLSDQIVLYRFGRKVLPKKPTSADRWYTWSSEFYAFLALCSQNSDLLILSKKTKVYISLYSLGTVVIK